MRKSSAPSQKVNSWFLVLFLTAIPFGLLLYQNSTGFESAPLNKLLLLIPLVGVFGIWRFLNFPWWLKVIFSVFYIASVTIPAAALLFGSACEQLAAQGRSCI